MGATGRYIDGLTDERKDKLVRAPDFNDGESWWDWEEECGCLVGTAEGRWPSEETRLQHQQALLRAVKKRGANPKLMWCVPWPEAPASIRFPQLVRRFGKARVVRAIKLRAGASVDDLDAQPSAEPAETATATAGIRDG